jgi:hypothetical protein
VTEAAPAHRVHVWAWLKRPAQRLILPDWLAITIGHDIFAWRALDEFELAHELVHVRQWSVNGIMYIPRYFAASRAAVVAGRDRYRGNAFEAEAYAAADALRTARAAQQATTPAGEPAPAAGEAVPTASSPPA